MIFNFRIVSDEVDNFKREIKVDATATFLDFKNAICESVGYDKVHSSYATATGRKKKRLLLRIWVLMPIRTYG